MKTHTFLALLFWLYERIRLENPKAPLAACWPTTDVVRSAVHQNRRYFPDLLDQVGSYRHRFVVQGWLIVGPCAEATPVHPCEHWTLTAAGLAALDRMNREKCGKGSTKGRCLHHPLLGFAFKRAA